MKITGIAIYRTDLPYVGGAYGWGGGNVITVARATVVVIETDANRLASWLCHYHLALDPVPGQGARNSGGVAVPPSAPGLGVAPDETAIGAPVATYE